MMTGYPLLTGKSSLHEYGPQTSAAIQCQLFGTSLLIGSPKLLVYATIKPEGSPKFTLYCIDCTRYRSYESWERAGRPSTSFPKQYDDPGYVPLARGSEHDLREDCSHADFRTVAASLHDEFFSSQPDTAIFTNLVKCLLAKIHDEKETQEGREYQFQVFRKAGVEDNARVVFDRVNKLYADAYAQFVDPVPSDPDLIDPKHMPPERVKSIVRNLEGMSLTRGAALHADIIGGFFEQILRAGFRQDKGMYFTHANLVAFIVEALDIGGLALTTWQRARREEERLPYIIDPAWGTGAFLLRAMRVISQTLETNKAKITRNQSSREHYETWVPKARPNTWARQFIYGLDPKFDMAITAQVNMVLHGDGSSHIFKVDALAPFSAYDANDNPRLRVAPDPQRAEPRSMYSRDTVESFDVVVSNPPFGIKLAPEVKAKIPETFELPEKSASEVFFLERWYQLLKPGGRLGVVVPESLLNTSRALDARLFLYRRFWIRAVVALPRNLFIDTPTLTSLLFAQKKTREEIEVWDSVYRTAEAETESWCQEALRACSVHSYASSSGNPVPVQQAVLRAVSPILGDVRYIEVSGREPLSVVLPTEVATVKDACRYYKSLLKRSGFQALKHYATVSRVLRELDYTYPAYRVEEVGFKLSKRKEKIRPNELCRFVSEVSERECPNLNRATDSEIVVKVNIETPQRVLDYIRRDILWA